MFSLLSVDLLVCLLAALHKNCWKDSSGTWWVDGPKSFDGEFNLRGQFGLGGVLHSTV